MAPYLSLGLFVSCTGYFSVECGTGRPEVMRPFKAIRGMKESAVRGHSIIFLAGGCSGSLGEVVGVVVSRRAA
jgi:hypothetical protein